MRATNSGRFDSSCCHVRYPCAALPEKGFSKALPSGALNLTRPHAIGFDTISGLGPRPLSRQRLTFLSLNDIRHERPRVGHTHNHCVHVAANLGIRRGRCELFVPPHDAPEPIRTADSPDKKQLLISPVLRNPSGNQLRGVGSP